MSLDLDIFRSAGGLMTHYGGRSSRVAAELGRQLKKKGDAGSASKWQRIAAAIDDFHRDELQPGERRQ